MEAAKGILRIAGEDPSLRAGRRRKEKSRRNLNPTWEQAAGDHADHLFLGRAEAFG